MNSGEQVTLGETGNCTIAAEHARVSRSWVTLHKTSDPEFRAACEAAVAGAATRAQEAATAGGSARPSAKWGYIDGEEMVVRAGNGRRAVVARARLRQWTPRVEARFLGVRRSCGGRDRNSGRWSRRSTASRTQFMLPIGSATVRRQR